MWFIFPQLRGLGRSETARFYAIVSRQEAQAYAEHPVLGLRLRECTSLVIASPATSLVTLFGSIDAVKFRSCMTLFSQAAVDRALFREALDKYWNGEPDTATVDLLARSESAGFQPPHE
jgi:uncharacterized protein (DUF1810 family)